MTVTAGRSHQDLNFFGPRNGNPFVLVHILIILQIESLIHN
jgi:hypothetical protein